MKIMKLSNNIKSSVRTPVVFRVDIDLFTTRRNQRFLESCETRKGDVL